MLIGSYSIPHLRMLYRDPEQQLLLRQYTLLLVFLFLLWVTALILLIYYWNTLEVWAQVIGIIGLFFNAGGSILTILVVFFGGKDTSSTTSPSRIIEEMKPSSDTITIEDNDFLSAPRDNMITIPSRNKL